MMASYRPLDTSKNEVRMLTILEVTEADEGGKECTTEVLGSWLDHTRSKLPSNYPAVSSLKLPSWRYTLHYESSDKIIDSWDHLMDDIGIDFDKCPRIPPAFCSEPATKYPALQPTTDSMPDVQYEDQFSFLPRFQWGDYEAISYCWESEMRDRQVVLNGSVIDVPRNLEAMLRRLRNLPEAYSGMKFWVDALCIDQNNISEKGHQVQLMQTIYARAFSLVVWLGSASNCSDKAIEFVASITHHTLLEDLYGEEKYGESFQKWARKHKSGMAEELPDMAWEELLTFLSRNYWHRLWIIQELALNHHMTLFLCGEGSISRSMILRTTQFCMRHAETIDQITPPSIKTVPDSSSYTYGSIWTTIYRVYCLITLPDGETDEIRMDDVLDLGRKANVKEAVDKGYGILGLLPSKLSAHISPDYTVAPEEVYISFAKVILCGFNNLDALFSWCSYDSGSVLPSWVPNWSTQYDRNHLYWLKLCRASGSKSALWSVSGTNRSLQCRGFYFDTIHGLSGSLSEINISGRSKAAAQFEPSLEEATCQYDTKSELAAALRRTLVQNLTYPGDELYKRTSLDIPWLPAGADCRIGAIPDRIRKIASSPCWIPFQRFREVNADFPIFGFNFRDFFPVATLGNDTSRIAGDSVSVETSKSPPNNDSKELRYLDGDDALVMKRTTLALQGRRIITTRNGYLGTAPEAVLRGDILVILYGCSYPVVLRPSSNSHLLIGESYIDGVMEGVLVQARDRGMFEEADFIIC